jgi:excisionase family DNA binding protein
MDKLLLTPAEAAHALGIGRTKLFELMASGELESVQIGHSRRVPRDALNAFLDQLRAGQSHSNVAFGRGA